MACVAALSLAPLKNSFHIRTRIAPLLIGSPALETCGGGDYARAKSQAKTLRIECHWLSLLAVLTR
jgi:hypothetical protein